MPSSVLFNGQRYLLSKIRVQAATGNDIAVKREDVVLDDADLPDIAGIQRPIFELGGNDADDREIPRVAVYQYGGKFFILNGLLLAREKFAESKSGTIKAKLLSKHMLKKCDVNHEGATIVQPAPPSRFGDRQNDYSRDRESRPRQGGYNSSIGYNRSSSSGNRSR
jgi:hypothetical protein